MHSRDDIVDIYVEISRGSNVKYEYNKTTGKLEIDRILPPPFFYPYAYGFIPHTLASDGDELDALILSDDEFHIDNTYRCRVVGVLVMEDEKGMDEKILAVPVRDDAHEHLSDLHPSVIDSIWNFFATYKTADAPKKWSIVHDVLEKPYATECVRKYRVTSHA